MKRGHSVNSGRKFAMLVMRPLRPAPRLRPAHARRSSPPTPGPPSALIALAAAAHQGWSANLFSTPADMFPSTAVSTVVGIGGAAGAAGGALFTWLVKHYLRPAPAARSSPWPPSAYLLSLAIFQLLVPRLGIPSAPDEPITVP